MNRQQIFVVVSAFALFFTLYFGCDTKSREQKALATSRILTAETLDMKTESAKALETLPAAQKADIQALTPKAASGDPSVLKQLSAAWHTSGRDDIAAWYAEQIAEKEKTEV